MCPPYDECRQSWAHGSRTAGDRTGWKGRESWDWHRDGLCQKVTPLVCSAADDRAGLGHIRRIVRSVPSSSPALAGRALEDLPFECEITSSSRLSGKYEDWAAASARSTVTASRRLGEAPHSSAEDGVAPSSSQSRLYSFMAEVMPSRSANTTASAALPTIRGSTWRCSGGNRSRT